MAYSTGSTTTLTGLYDALVTFMTSNGWTLYDTITTRDKVLTSNGLDGKRNMVYRLTSNAEAGNPFKGPGDPFVRFPHVLVRGYHRWDAPSDTGSGEFGKFGPWYLHGQRSSQLLYETFNSVSGVNPQVTFTHTPITDATGLMGHNGGRRVYCHDQATFKVIDIVHGESFSSTASPISNSGATLGCLTRDPTTDKEYWWMLTTNASTSEHLYRYDIDGDSWQRMAASNFSAVSNTGGWLCWDGNDTIYAAHGNATSTFSKYTISTDSWTALTAAPVTLPAGVSLPRKVNYVPNSVSGLGQDVIYAPLTNSGTLIYRYDVTSNAWRSTTGTGAIDIPIGALSSAHHIVFDNQRYLYLLTPAANHPNNYWRMDMQSISVPAPAWTAMGYTTDLSSGTYTSSEVFNQFSAKLRANTTIPMSYWFLGDADSVIAVVRIGASAAEGRYYWMYLGKYETAYRSTVMTLTGAASIGTRVTVTVDSTTGYVAGDRVLLFDPTTSNSEIVTIYDVPSGTTFRTNLTKAYTTGTRVGYDPTQQLLAGDGGTAATPLDGRGFQTNGPPGWYWVAPALSATDTANTAPSTRGAYMPTKFRVYNFVSTLATYETIGTLDKVFSLPVSIYPAPVAEELLNIGGSSYLFFPQQETSRFATDKRGIVIGPIS